MNGKWLARVRSIHTFLGVFFSPLLLLFVITGWWQTFQDPDNKKTDPFDATMERFSNIHTDDYWERAGGHPDASIPFKYFVVAMAVALIVTIVMGLALAFQSRKRLGWTALAFFLGILIPVLILYFT